MDEYDEDPLFDFSSDPPGAIQPTPGPAVIPQVERPADPGLGPIVADLDAPISLQFLGEVRYLLEEAERMRSHSMRRNPKTGKEEIYNTKVFADALAQRHRIVASAVKLHRDLLNDHAQAEFFRIVVQTIQSEAPPVAHRLIEALRAINNPVLEVIGKAGTPPSSAA